jgi:putative flippase GtrA
MISKDTLRDMFDPVIAHTALRVAAIVGTILVLISLYDLLLGRSITLKTVIQIILIYCVPYIVSTHGQVSARRATRTSKQ